VLLAAAAGSLARWFGLPAVMLREVGLFLLAFAALVAVLGWRRASPRLLFWAVIVGNALWAVDSVLLLVSGWVAPTAPGGAFVVAQALVVALLAELEYTGLRRSAPLAA
jgi:CHASE2 domain-containing sensor protein